MNEKTITPLEQFAIPEYAADIMCIAIDEFEGIPPYETVRCIDSIRCTDTAVHVRSRLPDDDRLVQIVIGIACRSELTHKDLVTDEEFDEIANDENIHMLHFVWVITKDSDLVISKVRTEDLRKNYNFNDTRLETVSISVIKAQN